MKSNESKTKVSRTKSLHIKLDVDHPIFSIPKGERSLVAREWMEQGRQVLAVMEIIQQELTDIKKALNNKLPQSHERFSNNQEDTIADNKPAENRKNEINPAIFLNL